ADTANRRIGLFTLDGTPAGFLHSALFQEPYALRLALDGALLVLDATAQQIFRVDPVSGGSQPLPLATAFYHPRAFAVDEQGNLMVADTGGARVAILQTDGQPAGEFGGPATLLGKGQPVDALWADGRLWAVTAEDGRLWRLDSSGSM